MNAQGNRKVLMVTVVSVVMVGAVTSYALATSDSNSSRIQPSSQQAETARTLPQPTNQQKFESEAGQQGAVTNNTTVTVNGQNIDVPENGSYSETTRDGDSRTDVKVESSNTSNSTGNSSSSNSSVNLNVTTESRSSSSSQ